MNGGGGTIKCNNNEQNTSITLQRVLQTNVRGPNAAY